ncbi:MAG: hypothetical protein RML46_07165 [Anaerolineae bacterium]|nr:hypothetical protein [Anaerolineae bacterium]
MDRSRIPSRSIVKLWEAIGVSVFLIILLSGSWVIHTARGEPPPRLSPYAAVNLEKWIPSVGEASPILLLLNERSDNPFGLYLGEVLRAEGLNSFQVASLSELTHIPLGRSDLILLAEGPLDDEQARALRDYVATGGRLVAMRPDARLASLFGLEWAEGTTTEGYLQIEPTHPVGKGIATSTLQFHGVADHYHLAGAQVVAWLFQDRETRTGFPAITLYQYGQGQAALWAFDLARSIAYTRQGNPSWANQERDGAKFIRASDMFVGWIDLDRLAIPQADEQQRLLVNLLTFMTRDARPLPRLWYFPGAAEGIFIATGDSHQNPASAVERVLALVEEYGGRMSIYYAPPLSPSDGQRAARRVKRWMESFFPAGDASARMPPTPRQIARWRAQGHEFTFHPYVDESLETGWSNYWKEFIGLGYGPPSPTVRTHRVLWTGWVESARLQASYGIRMNLDYYHWGPAFCNKTEECGYGYFTGSGLPMRFVDQEGHILNVYQQLTQLVDEHLLAAYGGPAGLSSGEATAVSRMLIHNSLERYPGAVVAQFHIDPFAAEENYAREAEQWLRGTLGYARARDIPIWSAEEWLRFTEARQGTHLEEIQWSPEAQQLRFQLVAPADPAVELAVMVPLWHGGARLVQVEVDGHPVLHGERRVGGVLYGWVSVWAGSHQIAATYR